MSLYSIVWKYKINPECKEKFELEYSSRGAWNLLFRQAKNYKGSYLHQSEYESDTYLLIDTWTNKQSYENFKRANKEAYKELSTQFDYLYKTEDKVGAFNLVS